LTCCNFTDGGGGMIVHALQGNTTLKTLSFTCNELDAGISDALTSVLLANTSLAELTVHASQLHRTWLHPFFVALRINTSLKKVSVGYLSDELVFGALRDVFANNSVLEELTLQLDRVSLVCDTGVPSWRRILPFLRDNKTLKSLVIILNRTAMPPPLATFC
jgi:hypothetical protein